jgi:hypothetical protein
MCEYHWNSESHAKPPVDSVLPEATTHIATCPVGAVLRLLAKRPSMTSIEDKLLRGNTEQLDWVQSACGCSTVTIPISLCESNDPKSS